MSKPFITRFAPSPTGFLHLGHAYSAMLAFEAAKKNCGTFLLRLEDIDQTRCRPEFEGAILEDLAWLGLTWETPVRRQSDHFRDYQAALHALQDKGLIYPCFCTRAEINAEVARSQSAPHGPEGPLYPGSCRNLSRDEQSANIAEGRPFAIRLDTIKTLARIGQPLTFMEKGDTVAAQPETLGDVVLARKDTPTSYHLSVVVDDHLQNVTHIIRGEDLLHATHIHRLLQAILGYKSPAYYHHGLLAGEDGKRFAKRDQSLTLKSLRKAGKTPDDLRGLMESYGANWKEVPF